MQRTKERSVDKQTHVHPGKQIRIILARCPEVIARHGNTELNGIYTITDRPTRRDKRNGDSGVWVETEDNPIFVWFFEFRPYVPVTMIRTVKPKMERTILPKFTRTR